MEKNSYQLVCTYLKNKYFISTIYRQSSAIIEDCWYFETIVWKFNNETKKRESIIEIEDSGSTEDTAMYNHFMIVKKLNEL